MDGYVEIAMEITDLLFMVISWAKETLAIIMPEDLSLAIKYAWAGMTNANAWVGYLMAALYYWGEDAGWGDSLCELSGYAFDVIDALHTLVDWQ